MEEYFILLLMVVGISVFGVRYGEERFLKLISVFLILFSGFRYHVGVDYDSYMELYKGTESTLWLNEIGFSYLIQLLNNLGLSHQAMFLVCAIIMQFFIHKVITYYSLNFSYSIIIYLMVAPFYLATFNGVRQFLAVGCFIYSLRFLDSKSYVRYILINILGILCFHTTLLLIAPLGFILNKKIKLLHKLILVMVIVVGKVLIIKVFENSPYASYLTHQRETPISMGTYIFSFIAVLIVFFENKIPKFKYKRIFINLNLLSLTTVLMAILADGVIRQLLMRMNAFFFISYIILIPNIISTFKLRGKKHMAYFILTIVLGLYYAKTIVISGEHYKLVPYAFNFNLFK